MSLKHTGHASTERAADDRIQGASETGGESGLTAAYPYEGPYDTGDCPVMSALSPYCGGCGRGSGTSIAP